MALQTLTASLMSCQEDPNFPVDSIGYEDTSSQVALAGDIPQQVWSCETDTLTLAEMQALRAFYFSRQGAYQSFYWVCPQDGLTYTVRFVDKTFKNRNVDGVNWKVSFSLQRITTA